MGQLWARPRRPGSDSSRPRPAVSPSTASTRASLLEITRQAGQRNRGAVHYHFGSRTGMLVAVLEQHLDVLAARERELLTIARAPPTTT